MRPLFVLVVVLGLAALGASARASAQSPASPDATVHALGANLIGRESHSAATPLARHPSGDLLFVADGVLRTDAQGTTRWHHDDPAVVDVAVSGDGTVYAMSRLPVHRPTRVEITRLDDQGRVTWKRTFHAGRLDPYTYPDLTGTAEGDVISCATLTRGGVVIDRIDPRGRSRWSVRPDGSGECMTVAAVGAEVVWAGHTAAGARAVVERLDGSGTRRWRSMFDGAPIPTELTPTSDGDLLLGGAIEGRADLLPGVREHLVTTTGYQSFVVRLDGSGVGRWAWLGGHTPLRSVLGRGEQTIVVEQGTATVLDQEGRALAAHRFGQPRRDGVLSEPFLSVTGALLDANGRVVLACGLPEADAIAYADYLLFTSSPYAGPRGSVLAWPGW